MSAAETFDGKDQRKGRKDERLRGQEGEEGGRALRRGNGV